MKKSTLFTVSLTFAFVVTVSINAYAQDTIVQWTFPSESGLADGGVLGSNLDQEIQTAGGTSEIQFRNGATTKSAEASGWDNGTNEKKWKVEFETTGYQNIRLFSKVSSGGTYPGPRDFKVQYRLGDSEWTDIENSEFHAANDWTVGVLNGLPVSNTCSDQSNVKLRWIMTSDTASDGSIVAPEGKSKIDDIYIVGDLINGDEEIFLKQVVKVYPNPANDFIVVQSESIVEIGLYDINGQQVIETRSVIHEAIDISELISGIYILKIGNLKDKSVVLQKIMIQ